MPLTLEEALETSAALEEHLAAARDISTRSTLEQKLAMVDFAAFGMFKQAWLEQFGPEMASLGKGLGWGVGLGVPAALAGHALLRDARHQGEELTNHVRNQALLTGLGLGAAQGVGGALAGMFQPKPPMQREEVHEMTLPNDQSWRGRNVIKLSSDEALQKIAAVVLLDNTLENQVSKLAGDERADALECLFLNRAHGTRLLRELLR
jgi:hypothetical protein